MNVRISKWSSSFLMGLMVAIGTPITLKLENIEYIPSHYQIVFLFIFGGLIGYLIALVNEKTGGLSNWESWSKLFHSQFILIYMIVFNVMPIIFKISKSINMSDHISPVFYAHWVCGLFLLTFSILYKLLCPRVYLYKNFQDFMIKSGSILEIKEDANAAYKIASAKQKYKAVDSTEVQVLLNINNYSKENLADAFYSIRKHIKDDVKYYDYVLFACIALPAYILTLIFTSNFVILFRATNDSLSKFGSIIKAIFNL